MNKRIYLEVTNELNRFIKKCIDNNINLYNISYKKDKIIVLIDVKDYLKIKRLNYYSKIRVIKYDGVLNVKKIIKDNNYLLFNASKCSIKEIVDEALFFWLLFG